MSVPQILLKNYKQTAVYWASPVNNGYGVFTFATPIEIDCRWEDKEIVMKDENGKELITSSQVFSVYDLEKEGFLYLGELTDLNAEQLADPKLATGAYEIVRTSKLPVLGSRTQFIRKAYLSWRLY